MPAFLSRYHKETQRFNIPPAPEKTIAPKRTDISIPSGIYPKLVRPCQVATRSAVVKFTKLITNNKTRKRGTVIFNEFSNITSVSYTHLTLPTIYSV